jgi:hypothetical protein
MWQGRSIPGDRRFAHAVHATREIQQPADVFRIDGTLCMGTLYPLLSLSYQAEQSPRSKVLQHRVLRILGLRELFKSFYGAIGVYCIVTKVAAHILVVQITGRGNWDCLFRASALSMMTPISSIISSCRKEFFTSASVSGRFNGGLSYRKIWPTER